MEKRIEKLLFTVILIFIGFIIIQSFSFSTIEAKMTREVIISSCVVRTGESTKPEMEISELSDEVNNIDNTILSTEKVETENLLTFDNNEEIVGNPIPISNEQDNENNQKENDEVINELSNDNTDDNIDINLNTSVDIDNLEEEIKDTKIVDVEETSSLSLDNIVEEDINFKGDLLAINSSEEINDGDIISNNSTSYAFATESSISQDLDMASHILVDNFESMQISMGEDLNNVVNN